MGKKPRSSDGEAVRAWEEAVGERGWGSRTPEARQGRGWHLATGRRVGPLTELEGRSDVEGKMMEHL